MFESLKLICTALRAAVRALQVVSSAETCRNLVALKQQTASADVGSNTTWHGGCGQGEDTQHHLSIHVAS